MACSGSRPAAPGTRDDAGSPTASSPAGTGDFCARIADSYDEAFGLGAANAPSPDEMRQEFERAKVRAEEAIAVAPADIRADLVLLTNAVAGLREALAGVNFDIAALGPGPAEAFSTPEFEQAATRTMGYIREHCRADVGGKS